MQKKRYERAAALLLAAIMAFTVLAAPVAAFAASGASERQNYDNNEYEWYEQACDDQCPYIQDEVPDYPYDYVQDDAPGCPCDDCDYMDASLCWPYECLCDPAELPGKLYEDIWQLQVTGGFYGLRLISIEYGIAKAVITQCAAGSQFYASSYNLTHWEITGPAAEQYDYTYITPYMDLSEAGIVRVERLPYQIEGSVLWVGFVVMEDTNGSIRREQICIFMDDVWLNPLPPEPVTAIAGINGFDWAQEAIEFVVARDLMNVYLCDETYEFIAFYPTGRATRGDVLAAAVKALGLTAPELPEAAHVPFYDVPLCGRGVYVDIAKQLGLVVGVGDNHFAPDHVITRQDMMTMLYNIMMAMGQIQPDTGLTALGRFNDLNQIAHHARLPISSLARAGIIAGDGVGINPRGYVNRVEAAMFVRSLYRVGE